MDYNVIKYIVATSILSEDDLTELESSDFSWGTNRLSMVTVDDLMVFFDDSDEDHEALIEVLRDLPPDLYVDLEH